MTALARRTGFIISPENPANVRSSEGSGARLTPFSDRPMIAWAIPRAAKETSPPGPALT